MEEDEEAPPTPYYPPNPTSLDHHDDDGRLKRTGTVWTAGSHIVTAVIGSGVLSLSWSVAQLGWIGGILALIFFSIVTYSTSTFLADCYRYPHPISGRRNYTYMDAVRSYLGGRMHLACAFIQYVYICGALIGYTITASISMVAVNKSNCYHSKGHGSKECSFSCAGYIIGFGGLQLLLSQIPNLNNLAWLSTIAAIMSFGYASIGTGLSISKVISGDVGKTSLTGVEIGPGLLSASQKTWNVFSALGDIAFAYIYSQILIEIQDTLKSTPPENKTMKKANMASVMITTVFYLLCGCFGYAAFGNDAPGNMLTGFGFYNPFWLVDIANIFIVIHLAGAYQVFAQPIYCGIESWVKERVPKWGLVTAERGVRVGKMEMKISMMRLVLRSVMVVGLTALALAMPFFNQVLALLGAIGYWPLTVYFPLEMYISQKKMGRWTTPWVGIQLMNCVCLAVALAAALGSLQGLNKAFHESH